MPVKLSRSPFKTGELSNRDSELADVVSTAVEIAEEEEAGCGDRLSVRNVGWVATGTHGALCDLPRPQPQFVAQIEHQRHAEG